MANYEKVITSIKIIFFVLHILMISIFLAIIIKYYTGFSEREYIWFCSKILTIKKMIKKNNINNLVFASVGEEGKLYYTEIYYLKLLEWTSKGKCLNGFKKCGILDTYGNPFCFPQGVECPINKVIFDLTSRLSLYQENNYDYYLTDNRNLYFYYKIGVEDSGIIVQWVSGSSQPKYINDNNFILDKDAFYECFGKPDKDDDDDDDDDYDDDYDDDDDDDDDDEAKIGAEIISGSVKFAGDLIQNAVKLERINKLIDYINKKINEDANIDYNFTYINNNQYVKNYIGFENLEAAKDFEKIDFDVFKSRYPTNSLAILAIIFLITNFVFTLVVIIFLARDGELNRIIFWITAINYIPAFLIFWIYSIVLYSMDFKNESFEIAKRIRADKYIEDFLKDFYIPFEKTGFILSIIILLTFSALLFITIFSIEPILECIEERKRKASFERNIAFNNINRATEQQNINRNNDNNRQVQLNTENVIIESNRGINGNMKQSEANINHQQNKGEVEANNNKPDVLRLKENNLGNQNKDFNTIAVEENNKQ